MLEVSGLHAFYGSSHVLFGVDVRVAEGEVVAVLGRNGMGKTTLIRSIMGLLWLEIDGEPQTAKARDQPDGGLT